MIHSNMKQIAIQNGYARPILRTTGLWNLQNSQGAGLRDDVNALRISVIGVIIDGMMHSMMKQIAF